MYHAASPKPPIMDSMVEYGNDNATVLVNWAQVNRALY